uniref:FHA domain-containing protein n=1 Tax=Rhabditophanes sp. KR3021 TaxID=114890 RepID=A0AC35TGU7_9BILA
MDTINGYKLPSWSNKFPPGFHLDCFKGDEFLEKVMIDEKNVYVFGRDPVQADIPIEHASCSRAHAILLYHDILKKSALVDLNSTHGSFRGKIKIAPFVPTFLEINDSFRFGASTRKFVVQEKPGESNLLLHLNDEESDEVDAELNNLTEYNTTCNKKKIQIDMSDQECRAKKRKRGKIQFAEEETILNLDEIDDKVGKFRNMAVTYIQTTDNSNIPKSPDIKKRKIADNYDEYMPSINFEDAPELVPFVEDSRLKIKKKYAKEAWPGKKADDGSLI